MCTAEYVAGICGILLWHGLLQEFTGASYVTCHCQPCVTHIIGSFTILWIDRSYLYNWPLSESWLILACVNPCMHALFSAELVLSRFPKQVSVLDLGQIAWAPAAGKWTGCFSVRWQCLVIQSTWGHNYCTAELIQLFWETNQRVVLVYESNYMRSRAWYFADILHDIYRKMQNHTWLELGAQASASMGASLLRITSSLMKLPPSDT